MASPIVFVMTQDSELTGLLGTIPEESALVFHAETLQDLVSHETTPAAVLFDVRNVRGGGHHECRLIDQIQDALPQTECVLLADSDLPETLERRVACNDVSCIFSAVEADNISAWLDNRFDSQPSKSTPTATATRPTDTAKVASRNSILCGITRQFETQTVQLRKMLDELEVAAQHDVTILLIGETGSGKTFLSRLIHEVSPRNAEPFLPVACGALPSELIESELFGHVKGAFTSAHADKEGKFVAAGRGTILLDEIDVLGPEQQVKLLRVIETGEFEAVGSNRTLTSQARLVVASNLDLQPLVEQGEFRPDLYYRLNMLKFEIPPLRNRKPDIEVLAKKFIEQSAQKHNVSVTHIDAELFEALLQYPWPGNVRELENVMQRAVIYCQDGHLRAEHLPSHIVLGEAGPTNDPSVKLPGGDVANSPQNHNRLERQVAVTERDIIEQALFKNNYSRTNTARELGISRVTLYNKMKKYGMSLQSRKN